MHVANPLCWFCHGAAHISLRFDSVTTCVEVGSFKATLRFLSPGQSDYLHIFVSYKARIANLIEDGFQL
jgi:hypothetical protein